MTRRRPKASKAQAAPVVDESSSEEREPEKPFEITEEEQWRLIRESGILQAMGPHPSGSKNSNKPTKARIEEVDDDEVVKAEEEELDDDDEELETETQAAAQEAYEANGTIALLEEMFDSVLYLIPFSCLYLGMDIMIKQQYSQHPSVKEELGQLTTAIPILAIFIFYTNRYKRTLWMQAGMTIASLASGCQMIYLVNRAPWGDVIRQSPPLGVIWVYTVAQVDLLFACLALLGVYGFVRHYNLKIIF